MLSIFDVDHRVEEERWITLGISQRGLLLLVCHIFQESPNRILVRIHSARKATKKEITAYQENLHEA